MSGDEPVNLILGVVGIRSEYSMASRLAGQQCAMDVVAHLLEEDLLVDVIGSAREFADRIGDGAALGSDFSDRFGARGNGLEKPAAPGPGRWSES